MLKTLLRSGLLVLLTLPLAAQTEGWKRHKNIDGNFTILFPGEPQDNINKSESDINSHTVMYQNPAGVYTVVYTTMASEQRVDDATYEMFKNSVFKELPKCDVGAEGPPSLVLSGYIGHSYRLNCDMPNTKVTVMGNLYWGKHYSYAVMVMYRSNVSAPTATNQFLASFAVIDQTR